MIFVVTGTQLPFDRLIRMLDEIAPQLDEEIVAQVNGSGYLPRHINTIDLLPPDEFDRLFSSARLIVAHAGIGTIITAMQQQKPIIIFPRIAALGEHRNEHQLATAEKMKEAGLKRNFQNCCRCQTCIRCVPLAAVPPKASWGR